MMIQPTIKGLEVGASQALEDFLPENREFFQERVTALIGPADVEGADLFEFWVCSAALIQGLLDRGHSPVSPHVLVERYSPELIETTLNGLIAGCTASTWSEVAKRVRQFAFAWEFDGYD